MLTSASVSPTLSTVEDIQVMGFQGPEMLFDRIIQEIRRPGQSIISYVNVHVANQAFRFPRLKRFLKQADVVYCDGAGIVLASKLLGQPLPCRLAAADWFIRMMDTLASAGCSVYLLGGEPGVPEKALEVISEKVPHHTVCGVHHGYILHDAHLETQVIEQINTLQPDLLIVGFGTPLQEFWIERNRNRLNARAIYAIGAVMDYHVGKLRRCPAWMGDAGLEWLFRLYVEPVRLFARYVIGNPWFLLRISACCIKQSVKDLIPRQPVPQR